MEQYLKISNYFRLGKIVLKKEGNADNYTPPKVAVYDTTIWAEAVLQFENWKEAFCGSEPVKALVFEDYYFVSSIWEKNGIRYSGIHRMNDESEIIPRTGVNLDNYEWKNVMKKAEDINIALYGPQAAKGQKRSSPGNELEMWSCGWLLNGVEVETFPYKLEFFSEEEARKFGEQFKPSKKAKTDNLQLCVVSEYKKRPEETTQMKIGMVEIVRLCIEWCRKKFCEACQLDPPAPGQKAHMKSGGCLDPAVDGVIEYTEDIMAAIAVEDLVAVYNTVCRFLAISPQGSALLAKGAKTWICNDEMFDLMRAYESGSVDPIDVEDPALCRENGPLRRIVRGVIADLKVDERIGNRIQKN